jgi:branched-chain amino acid transport system permease protein
VQLALNLSHIRQPKDIAVPAILLAVASVAPFIVPSPYVLHVMVLILFYVGYASSWNILAYSGQVSFGHAAFLGLGGYISALISIKMGILWIGILVGGAGAAAIGLLIGLTCVRLREWFLALVTFGFTMILEAITIEFDWITAGTSGMAVPPLLPSPQTYYYLMLLLALCPVVVMYFLRRSAMGLAFQSIRENELEANASGVNSTKYKIIGFTLSTFLTGVLGAAYAHYVGFINPQIYSLDFSFWPVIMTVIGGMATLEGPIVGAAFLMFVWEFLRMIDPRVRLLLIGVTMVLVMILMPRGIVPLVRSRIEKPPEANSESK